MKYSRKVYRQELARFVCEYAAAARRLKGTILDLGCGPNPRWWVFSAHANVLGVESDRFRVEQAQDRLPKFLATRYQLLRGDATGLPISNNSADAVVFSFLLCTSGRRVPAVLSEVRRVLRPGGTLLALE